MSSPAPLIYAQLRRDWGFLPAAHCRMAVQPIRRICQPADSEVETGWLEFLLRPTGRYAHLSPETFVRHMYAGEVGLELDRMVLGVALGWLAGQRKGLRASINIHPGSLRESSFADGVIEELERLGLPGKVLCLELIEFGGEFEVDEVCAVLEKLRGFGVAIAIDDFGKGTPNLQLCAAGYVDYLKIDRCLIRDIAAKPGARTLVQGLASLATELNMQVIAEGVETVEQLGTLLEIGVPWIQGYLLDRPYLIEI